ncbi:hypothetical protein A2690_03855 [Candidatus Roizmanbacteria bacterium RIFCSPHIGHO2_01_FULL_39_12b]|uniref:Uncharacterized protein n=1 Tax=Candidatus Roizmanbacteria bacterium RIFCSPHIGHO2_01_FULL_39_12b TaxID=1802030 RepID=A0A1F7GCB1_9BACT|nr:MAG: hypothetical protein A2690_03855 [Candidatus Roizmanbacteria bacterium RIFCSPHIGHO2_01_FULL_39_12b]OGK47075.1 MAG: hypothetical protein A3B46_01580 [Candidatus Roizmanbacteria bacterium RIFCSPLOWO2_01_FULL_39_19]
MLDFLNKKKVSSDIYLALSLQEAGAEVFLLQCTGVPASVVILGQKSFSFTNSWERLVEDVDEVLYSLEQAAGVKATRCIIFVYSHLVDINKKEIKEPYLDKIKAISDELGLVATGFMEYHEILSSYFSKNGSGQFNGILCEIDGSFVSFFVYRNGHLDLTKTINRTTDYVETIEVELSELAKTKTLPLRLVLYGIGSLENDAAAFMSKRWSKDIFVQLPKVEVMTNDQIAQALTDSLKSQLLVNDASVVTSISPPTADLSADTLSSGESSSQFDVSDTGFVIGADIQDKSFEPLSPKIPEDDSEFVAPTNMYAQTNKKTPFNSFKFFSLSLKSTAIVFAGLILVVFGLYTLLYSFHKASITLLYDTKPITRTMIVNAATLSVKSKTDQIKATGTIETTGSKFVGEKARGEVSILNKNKDQIILPKGTILLGPKDLRFTLDTETKIASASEQLTSEGNILTVTGKEKTSVTAADIGEEYNLKENTKFEIQNANSGVVAQAIKTLSGGSKKEVRTASRDDFEKLRKEVTSKIKTETKKRVKSENNNQVIDPLTEVKVINEKFSKEIAEEAGDLTLDATAKVKYYFIPLDTAQVMLSTKLAKSIPKDQTLDTNAISFSIKSATLDNGRPKIKLAVKGLPRQKVDTNSIKKSLVGKSVSQIGEISKQYQANGFEYQIETELPMLKSRLPFFTKNLTIIVKTLQ